MEHAFNTNIASQYDVNIAILLHNFKFWTLNNLANRRNIYDGLCWSYDTLEALADIFPYWSKRQLERIINNAVDAGMLKKANYNQTKYDRTVWYALTEAAYAFFPELLKEKYLRSLYLSISPNGEMDFAQWRNRFPQTVTPIPDTNPDTNPYINNISTSDEVRNLSYTDLNNHLTEKEKSDYKNNQKPVEKSDCKVIEKEIDSDKSDYFENQSKYKTNVKNSNQFGLKDILIDNIYQIPEQMIVDWFETRKKKRAPVTQTAWNKILKELGKCKEAGIEPLEAFETMVASGWQSLKADWLFTKEIISKQEASKKRTIELEQLAAHQKQKEIEDSKKFTGIVSQASEHARRALREMIGSRPPSAFQQRGHNHAHV